MYVAATIVRKSGQSTGLVMDTYSPLISARQQEPETVSDE
jgi:hypothetical protein